VQSKIPLSIVRLKLSLALHSLIPLWVGIVSVVMTAKSIMRTCRVIIGGARHPMEWVSMSPVFYAGRDSVRTKFAEHVLVSPDPVNIGNDVWIGSAAILLSGISVGDGAVVGAGSVVTKDVPPYAIVAGNPAKLIRYRFDNETIKKIMEIKWWNFTDEQLLRMGKCFNQPNCFFKMMKSIGSNDGV